MKVPLATFANPDAAPDTALTDMEQQTPTMLRRTLAISPMPDLLKISD
jgi:hypothetical protein